MRRALLGKNCICQTMAGADSCPAYQSSGPCIGLAVFMVIGQVTVRPHSEHRSGDCMVTGQVTAGHTVSTGQVAAWSQVR